MRLKEKVAVITGAKSGIGLATVFRFADEGAKFVMADIRDAHQDVDEIARRGQYCNEDVVEAASST